MANYRAGDMYDKKCCQNHAEGARMKNYYKYAKKYYLHGCYFH